MENIKVKVHVPLEAALAAGKSKFGDAEISLDDNTVAALSVGARALLQSNGTVRSAGDSYGCEDLPVVEATIEATVRALEERAVAVVERELARQSAMEAEDERKVAEALSLPDSEWIHNSRWSNEAPSVRFDNMSDPRIVARRAEVSERVLPGAVAAYEAKRAAEKEAKAKKEAEQEAEKARRESMAHDARLWVVEHEFGPPEFVRAAREGRDIMVALRTQISTAIRCAVEQSLPHDGAFHIAETYGEEERAGVPSAKAYALLDTLTAALPVIAKAARIPGATATVGAIMRFDVEPTGPAVYRTGVSVTVSHLWLETAKLDAKIVIDVLTEAPPEEDEDSDD